MPSTSTSLLGGGAVQPQTYGSVASATDTMEHVVLDPNDYITPPPRLSPVQSNAAASPSPPRLQRVNSEFPIDEMTIPPPTLAERMKAKFRLDELRATAICGNDITSSVLYTAGLCTAQAGKFAPFCLLLVAGVLYLFRAVYAEVGSAFPVNGGTYNLLLNTSSKTSAAIAGCLTLLSYVATAVVCALSASHYLSEFYHDLNCFVVAFVILAIFAVLNILGLAESSLGAVIIFIFHLGTMMLFVLCCCDWLFEGEFEIFEANWQTTPARGDALGFYLGYSTGLLGISGFETAANYIEEIEKDVFPKTLRNAWVLTSILNPTVSFLALGLMNIPQIANSKDNLLSEMAEAASGNWLSSLVVFDAVLVLCGAVLTSYVGVTGLLRRLAIDGCLPQFMLTTNEWRGTNHVIIIGFFGICCSLNAVTQGNIVVLGGVYTVAFLSVMALFAYGNLLLKSTRGRMPRNPIANTTMVIMGYLAVLAGLVGYIIEDYFIVGVFFIYFMGVFTPVWMILKKRPVLEFISRCCFPLRGWARKQLEYEDSRMVVFLYKNQTQEELQMVIRYLRENESARWMKICHISTDKGAARLALRAAKPIAKLHRDLHIDFVCVDAAFQASTLARLAENFKIPQSSIWLQCPGPQFPFSVSKLAGARIIL